MAFKNACRGTLDSKTQTKERKWVTFELLKFILGSAAEGNKTKEMNYSSLNPYAISFLLYPTTLQPNMDFYQCKLLAMRCVEPAYSQASYFLCRDRPVPV